MIYRKLLIQALLITGIFFSLLFVMRRVDWVGFFKIDSGKQKTEELLGELLWDVFKQKDGEILVTGAVNAVDSIVSSICRANHISPDHFKLHIVKNEEINAFMLPDGHLIIYSGLLIETENAEELAGVLGHEMAHHEQGHVMKKLIREVGLSVLVSITLGNGTPEVIQQVVKLISSSAFDRKLEEEADLMAVKYLQTAQIETEPFAQFLFRLAKSEGNQDKYLSWINTHPNSEERAKYILEAGKTGGKKYKPVISDSNWESMKKDIRVVVAQ